MEDYTNLEKVRLGKLARLRELGIEAYPRRVERTHAIADATEGFLKMENEEARWARSFSPI